MNRICEMCGKTINEVRDMYAIAFVTPGDKYEELGDIHDVCGVCFAYAYELLELEDRHSDTERQIYQGS